MTARVCSAVAGLLLLGTAAGDADDILIARSPGGRVARAAGDRVLVRLREPTDASAAFADPDVAAATDVLPDARLAVVWLAPGQTVEAALRRLRGRPNVLAAEPDYVVRPALSPNDPLWNDQCALRRAQLPGAWNHQRGRADLTVAILDSGVAYDHPDLAANLRRNSLDPPNGVDDDGNGLVDDFRGWDFADRDNDPHADRGDGFGLAHGTHVAGIAAAVTDNRVGVAGAGWGCTYLPVRVVDAFGVGYLSDVARGIEYAVDQGCAVVNLSLEGPFSRAIQAAIDYAYERGVVVCAAAGNTALAFTTDPATWTSPVCNDGDDPARQNRVIGVAAVGCDDVKLPGSNYGETYAFIDLAAPGRSITSAWWPGGGYGLASGTSQATPCVAGVAALLIARHGRLGPDAITQLLRSTADNIDGENPGLAGRLGAGRINAREAVLVEGPGPIVRVSLEVLGEDGTPGIRALPGTGVEVRITLRNLGPAAATNVRATLTSGDPRVVVKRGQAWYGRIDPGQAAVSAGGYRLRVLGAVPEGTRVPLSLAIRADTGGPWTEDRLALPVGWDALGEPDDACTEAFPAQLGRTCLREIGGVLDQDWFRFAAQAGTRYLIETGPRLGSSPSTALSIREPDCGREVLFVPGEDGPAQVSWVCPLTGAYLVGVTGGDGLWTGPYRFRVSVTGSGAPGPVQVTRLTVDDDRVGASAGNGDGWADPGEMIELRAELTNAGPLPLAGVTAGVSTNRAGLRVVAAEAGFPDLAPGRAAWSTTPYVLEVKPGMVEPAAAVLRFAVTTAGGAWDAAASLPVGRSGVGEPDDTCAAAVLISPDDFRHLRAFETPDDSDWFAFDALAGVRYDLATRSAGDPAVDTVLALRGPFCGPPITFGQAAAGRLAEIAWRCPESGRYGTLVRPAPGSALGPYRLSLRALDNLGPGEPDDTCAQASELTVGGAPLLRDFAVPGDLDWFRFPADDGATYVIETGPAPGQTPREVKSPPDGSPRAPDTVLKVSAPDCGAWMARNDDSGAGLFSRIVLQTTGGGVYGVRVAEVNAALGAYQVWVRPNRAPTVDFTGTVGYEADPVEPASGTADNTRFRFRVLYRDAEGDPAAFVRVRLFVGGVETAESPVQLRPVSGDPQTGVTYAGGRTLPAGEYRCRIHAHDGSVPAIGPAAEVTRGPSVQAAGTTAAAALITSLSVLAEPRRFAEVRFTLAAAAGVSARILNVAGREVRVLAADRPSPSGTNTLTWDGAAATGLRAAPGTYLLELTVRSESGERHSRLASFRW